MLRLVISLDRKINRWETVEKQFLSQGIEVQRVSAVDAQNDKIPWNLVVPLGSFEKVYSPMELSGPEICCYLSHIKCWEQLLSSGERWAAIFEDDILLSSRAKDFLLTHDWIPEGIHILQLHTSKKEELRRTLPKGIPVTDKAKIFRIIKPSVGTCGYLIDRTAAKKALELSKKIAVPVDEFLFNFKSPFTALFPTRGLNPACVFHNFRQFPSTIESIRKNNKRLTPPLASASSSMVVSQC